MGKNINGRFTNVPNINDILDDLQNQIDQKQDELVSGENIKTLNGESILGSGDLSLKPLIIHNTTENGDDTETVYNGADVVESEHLTTKDYVDAREAHLQQQINTLSGNTRLAAIVNTKAELDNYDTTGLEAGKIIEVLHDESQNGATSYYEWVVILGGESYFSLIGSTGPFALEEGPLPKYTVNSLQSNVLEFLEGKDLDKKLVAIKFPADSYIGYFRLTYELQNEYEYYFQSLETGIIYHDTRVFTFSESFNNLFSSAYATIFEDSANKVTLLSDQSTDIQYPSAKAVYDSLETGLAGKVDKTNATNKLYGTWGTGEQGALSYTTNVVGNTIMMRGADGQVQVPETPTADNNAASKKYIDDKQVLLQQNIDASGHSLVMSVDSSTYVLTVNLKDANNNTLSTQSVDLPLESIVVSATYYDTYVYESTVYEKVIVIILSTTDIPTIVPVGDLVTGLVSESTYNAGMALKADKATTYTKTESDTLLANKADKLTTYTKTETDTLLGYKADAHTVYTKTESDILLSTKANSNAVYTKDQVYTKTESDTLLSAKADINTTYTKTETDTLLADKADISTTYTKVQTDGLLANKQDTIDNSHKLNADLVDDTSTTNKFVTSALINDINSNTSARHTHSNKSLLDTYTQTEVNLADAVDKKHSHSNKAILDATTASYTTSEATKLSGIATGAQVNTIEGVKLNSVVVDPDSDKIINLDNIATNQYVDTGLGGKQDTLVSGTNIKTINNLSIIGSGNLDVSNDDMEVELSTDGGTTYDTAISGLTFKENCESGTYTVAGTIARIKNKNTNEKFRIILLGTNHDVLAKDLTTTVKTTWQFYDIPVTKCSLGLPFNVIDWGSVSGRAYVNDYLNGTNVNALAWYPSNKAGYQTAVGLVNSLYVIYEALPLTLQHSIKLVNKTTVAPRLLRTIAASGGTETDGADYVYVACTLFHLSAKETGSSNFHNEGSTYEYMSSDAHRIRYHNGSASAYWTRTPYPSNSSHWGFVATDGTVTTTLTHDALGVAPAFCI